MKVYKTKYIKPQSTLGSLDFLNSWCSYITWNKEWKILDKLHNGFINRPHYTEFVYCWQETFKRGVHTAKSRLPLKSCYKFSFFPRDVYMKKWQFFIFFLFKVKRHVWMTRIKMITNFREVFSRFGENKNAINISSLKNWFQFLWVLLKPFHFIKGQ